MQDPSPQDETPGEPLGMTGYLAPEGFVDDLIAELGTSPRCMTGWSSRPARRGR